MRENFLHQMNPARMLSTDRSASEIGNLGSPISRSQSPSRAWSSRTKAQNLSPCGAPAMKRSAEHGRRTRPSRSRLLPRGPRTRRTLLRPSYRSSTKATGPEETSPTVPWLSRNSGPHPYPPFSPWNSSPLPGILLNRRSYLLTQVEGAGLCFPLEKLDFLLQRRETRDCRLPLG